ncbi:MAG: TonB-dependent receptor [Bacteroidaceae bacterium]|nr:TonB-dependent receptor [Bacteroidaceae bacterium]
MGKIREEDLPIDTTFHLNDVVVTATRTPKLLKDVPIQTRLITEQDIEKVDATHVQDLLQQEMPGVEFTYAMNQQVHLNLSGFGGQSILFLVDGERLAGETMDDVDFTRLNMTDVQRIEIVKGAASALYGSNAGGGVVNIITKDDSAPWKVNLNARIAKHNEQRYGSSFSLNGKRIGNTFHFNYTSIDNFDVNNADNPQTRVFSTVYGDQTYHVKDKITFRPMDGMKIIGRAGYFYRTLSRTPDIPERYRDFTAGLRGIWEISPADNIDISYSFDQYDKSDYQKITRLDIRDYSNVQNSFRGLYNHTFGNLGILTAGADFMHDYLFNQNLDDKCRKQDSFDAFTQIDWTLSPAWELVGAVRYDYFSDTHDSHFTPKLTVCYRPHNSKTQKLTPQKTQTTLRFGYGMGFRAPTLKEKYYNFDMAGIWMVEGNPNLQAEISHNFNASIEWTRNNYNFTASTYYNKVKNKIATGMPYSPSDPSLTLPSMGGNTVRMALPIEGEIPRRGEGVFLPYLNLENYAVYGAEATLQAYWEGGFSAKISYAFTKEQLPKDKEGNTVNNQYIPARAHSLTARFDWDKQFSKNYGFSIGISGRFLSSVNNVEYIDYYDISRGTQTVNYPAYTLWKLSTVQRIGKAVKVTLALDNLFNYKPRYYYLNSPVTDGINLQAGISVTLP